MRKKKPVRRRRTSLKRIVLSLLVMLVVGIAGIGGVALWGMNQVQAPGPLEEPTSVVIEHGQPTTKIGQVLEQEGVVSDQRLFVLTTYLTRSGASALKAGEYEFPAGASLLDVLAIIRSGRSVIHKVTIPEGWTSAQVVERVNAHPALIGDVTDGPEEGSLLPDTYVFQRGTEREVLIARMRDAQTALLDELWESRAPDLPIETKEEAVILASIVEKETAVAEERQQVASVFVNRLRRNMRLQSDPTIIYGITNGERPLDRPIRRSDISEETPYNTYRIDGLPPTPIANPGREAIAAVLQPDDTDHLYFVADGSGGHAFAPNLDEHNKNVRRWREIERAAASEAAQQSDEAPEPAAEAPESAAEEPEPATEEPEPATEEPEPATEEPEPATEEPEPAVEEPDESAAAMPADTSAPVPGAPASGNDKADDIAATAARDETVAPQAPAEAQAAPAEEASPASDSEPDPAETLAEAPVPVPRPKPTRD